MATGNGRGEKNVRDVHIEKCGSMLGSR